MVTFLDVPYCEKDDAKSMGAKWNPVKKSWFAPNDEDELIERWGENMEEDVFNPYELYDLLNSIDDDELYSLGDDELEAIINSIDSDDELEAAIINCTDIAKKDIAKKIFDAFYSLKERAHGVLEDRLKDTVTV